MKKLIEVEVAQALMTEAIDWSVVKWLSEKKRVRRAADKANAVLDAVEKELQDSWPDDLKSAYSNGGAAPPEIKTLAKKLKDAHEAAIKFRMDAEDIFDKAERRLSTAMAREGCHLALKGWELHLESIRKAESAASVKQA